MMRPILLFAIPLVLTACNGPEDQALAPVPSVLPKQAPRPLPSPSDAVDPTSVQAGVEVVRSYFTLIENRQYGEAWRLWGDDGEASGMSEDAFADSFTKYADHHGEVGAPAPPEGAAGSIYVEVPVKVSGTLKSGWPFNMEGRILLRRVNDVPGATEAQRRWHIASSGVRPRP